MVIISFTKPYVHTVLYRMLLPTRARSNALTQRSRVFLEKLTVALLVQTLTVFY